MGNKAKNGERRMPAFRRIRRKSKSGAPVPPLPSNGFSRWEPPDRVVDAMTRAMTLDADRSSAVQAYIRALAHISALSQSQIALGTDVASLIDAATDAFARDCRPIVAASSLQQRLPDDASALPAGFDAIEAPLDENGRCDFDALQALVDENSGLVVFSNPDRLTGSLANVEAIAQCLEALPPTAAVAIDESSREFVTEEDPDATLALLETSNVLLLRPLSSTLGLSGFGVASCFSSDQSAARMRAALGSPSAPVAAYAAALASLDSTTRTLLENRIRVITQLRERFQACLDAGGFPYVPSQSDFVLLLCDDDARTDMLVQADIGARPIDCPRGICIPMSSEGELDRAVELLGLSW